jgi:hypothetical protein
MGLVARAGEALGVDLEIAVLQSGGVGIGTDEEKDMADRPRGLLAGLAVGPIACTTLAGGCDLAW